MSGNLYHAFGQEIVQQRRSQFESAARHDGLVRALRRARKVDRSAPASDPSAHRAPRACCAADLG
jgi:hypothetical protein